MRKRRKWTLLVGMVGASAIGLQLGLVTGVESANAFPTTGLLPGATAHTDITYWGMADAVGETLGPAKWQLMQLNSSTKTALKQIYDANDSVDAGTSKTVAANHFDGEEFVGGQAFILSQLNAMDSAVARRDFPAARAALGRALHTTQDFYAHSNWVELGISTGDSRFLRPSQSLGRRGYSLPPAAPGTTCGPDGSTLTWNGLSTSYLTSGYFPGEKDHVYKNGKCRHGTIVEKWAGGWNEGISKDVPYPTQGHWQYNGRAVSFARSATAQLLRDLRDGYQPRSAMKRANWVTLLTGQ